MTSLTTVRQIGDVPVVIIEVFHRMSHTAGNHAETSIDVTKLIKMSAGELFFFIRNPITACWKNDTSFTAILSQWVMRK
jgi:hypothetical protein